MGDRVVVPLGDYHKLQLAIWSGVRSEFYAKDGNEERTEFCNGTTLVCGPISTPNARPVGVATRSNEWRIPGGWIDYGYWQVSRLADGTVVVDHAGDVIVADWSITEDGGPFRIDEHGCLVLDTAGEYRYRPTQLKVDNISRRTLVVLERVSVTCPESEPPFRHANGEPCHGCQSCLADACEDDDDDRTESVSKWNPVTRQFELRPASTGG